MPHLTVPALPPGPDDAPPVVALMLRRGLGVLNLVMAFAIAIALTINISDRLIQGIFNPSH